MGRTAEKILHFLKNLWKYNNALIAVLIPLLLLPLIVIDGENDIQDPTNIEVKYKNFIDKLISKYFATTNVLKGSYKPTTLNYF